VFDMIVTEYREKRVSQPLDTTEIAHAYCRWVRADFVIDRIGNEKSARIDLEFLAQRGWSAGTRRSMCAGP
jgi:hypothetical protein